MKVICSQIYSIIITGILLNGTEVKKQKLKTHPAEAVIVQL